MFTSLRARYGNRTVGIGIFVILITVMSIAWRFLAGGDESAVVKEEPRAVTVAPIGVLGAAEGRSFVGSVRAVNEAQLQAEVGGRVVSVPVEVGQRVPAGAVIVQLENAAQRAAVTQAEGAYEAALASAAQGDSGLRSAQTALTSAEQAALRSYQNAYTAVNGVLIGSVDPFYSNPQTSVPGLRVGGGNTSFLIAERVAFRDIMPRWQKQSVTAEANNQVVDLLTVALSDTRRMIAVLDALIDITARAKSDDALLGLPLSSYSSGLSAARASLNGVVADLEGAVTGVSSAKEALARATLSGTSAETSLANAQVKQALGTLQAAQAALSKTIVRSPIAGTVNSISVKAGDTLAPGAAVAQVVNSGAYELSIFVSETERTQFSLGTAVTINGNIPGTVTAIGSALDARTQKIEIKIAIESVEVLSGSTAVVALPVATSSEVVESISLRVPVPAVAFAIEGGALLIVRDDVVTALPVTLGEVRGSYIEVSGEDLTPTTEIITDARGLIVGQTVSVAAN